MNDLFNVYNIIFLVLAVVIFLRLRSVLGKRTGNERPPFDPYSRKEGEKPVDAADKVITLPRRGADRSGEEVPQPVDIGEEEEQRLANVAPRGSALEAALKTILSADRAFDPTEFLKGARTAYEMIVTAFAEGDRRTLKQLLSPDVYQGFVSAIADRESRGETVESTFIGIDKAEIVEAELRGRIANITVRFVSQLISTTRDKEGRVIEGDPNAIADVTDIWTFSRDTTSRDPNWKLIATESAS